MVTDPIIKWEMFNYYFFEEIEGTLEEPNSGTQPIHSCLRRIFQIAEAEMSRRHWRESGEIVWHVYALFAYSSVDEFYRETVVAEAAIALLLSGSKKCFLLNIDITNLMLLEVVEGGNVYLSEAAMQLVNLVKEAIGQVSRYKMATRKLEEKPIDV